MAMASFKRGYGDDSSESSRQNSPIIDPRMGDRLDDSKKISETVSKQMTESPVPSMQWRAVAVKGKTVFKATSRATTLHTHGLAPRGMKIPAKGDAYIIGINARQKQPLKESNLEKFIRIKEEKEIKKRKNDKKVVKKLKKEGKVSTLLPFMYS